MSRFTTSLITPCARFPPSLPISSWFRRGILFPSLSWNGAAWFVSVEFLLCLLLPLYLAISCGGWKTALVLIAAGAGGLAVLASPRYGLDLTFHDGIWRGMAAFGMGVGMAMLHREMQGFSISYRWCSAMQTAVLAWLFYGIYRTGWSHRPQDILTVYPIIALVFVLAFDRGLVADALKAPPLLKLGEWSYAIYIGQTPLEQFLRHAQKHLYPARDAVVFGRPWAQWSGIWHWLEPALLVGAAILWGWLLFTAIERPAGRALRRMIEGPRGAAPA